MNKKKLLITLGCSFTEGVGCYEDRFLIDGKLRPEFTPFTAYNESLEKFHTKGWPAKLQKLLGYDHLINLGCGGSSNSFAVKRWMEVFDNKNYSNEYDVLVIWMMTSFARLSVYREGKLFNILPNNDKKSDDERFLYNSYINFVSYNESTENINLALDQLFYLKLIQNICKLSNYKLLYFNLDSDNSKLLNTLSYDSLSEHNLNQYLNTYILGMNRLENRAFCGHLNEKGYTLVANQLFDVIKKTRPYLINKDIPETFSMEYLGKPKQW